MQWDPIILICVYRLFVVVACCITYVVFYNKYMEEILMQINRAPLATGKA